MLIILVSQLQKFAEDDNYNQSLKIEPAESFSGASSSNQSTTSSGVSSLQQTGLMPPELGKKLAEATHSATAPLPVCTFCKCGGAAADTLTSTSTSMSIGRDVAETSSLASPHRTPDTRPKSLTHHKFDLFGRAKRLSVSAAAHENPAASLGPDLDSPERELPGTPVHASPSAQSNTSGKQSSSSHNTSTSSSDNTSKSSGLLNQLLRLSTRHKRNKSGSLSGPSTRSGTPAPESSSGTTAAAAAAAAAACACKCHQPPVHSLRHLIDDSLIEEPINLTLQRSHLHDTITEVNSSKEHSPRNSESPLLENSVPSSVNTQSATDSSKRSHTTRRFTPDRLITLTPSSFFEPCAASTHFDVNCANIQPNCTSSTVASAAITTSTPSR